MKLRVVWFGRPGGSPFEGEVATYRRRVARRWPNDEVALRPAAARRGDPARALVVEATAARAHLPAGWHTVVLDEQGDASTSPAFAARLAELEAAGTPGVVFIVGSDLGVAPELRAAAAERLALGPMTLPHLLARLLLWEQLFRASSILAGGAYHRSVVQ